MSNGTNNQNSQNNQQGNNQQKSGLSWNDPRNNSQSNPQRPTTPGGAGSMNNQPVPTSSGRLVAMFLAGVILCGLIVWGIAALRAENRNGASVTSTSTSTGTATSTATSTAATSTGAVKPSTPVTATSTKPATVTSPSGITSPAPTTTLTAGPFKTANQPAGNSVTVTNLAVTEAMWLVVYDDVSGQPGRILGAGMVFPGEAQVPVPLQRATEKGKTYRVGMSKTDNGSHTFAASLEKLNQWSTFVAQ